MKKAIACLLFVCVAFHINAQIIEDIPRRPLKPRKVPKAIARQTPPGTAWLKDNLYFDKTEISNIDWMEFVFWMRRHETDIDSLNSLFPDTTCWNNLGYNLHAYPSYYLRHPDFQQFPVVGVSPQQAIAYCQWRTDRVNESLAITNGEVEIRPIPPYNDMSKIKKRIKYRLPTKDEWEYAATGGVDLFKFPHGQKDYFLRKGRGYFTSLENPASNTLLDYIVNNDLAIVNLTSNIYNGRPNAYGYYNMMGNVQELVADTFVKGGSFNHIIDGRWTYFSSQKDSVGYATINRDFKYIRPEPYIGFRCICELLEKY